MAPEPPRNANIRDVARLAGVSPTTVSHALGGRRPVAESTRQRIIEAADRLGYRPHPGARSLKASGTGVLGMCVANVSDGVTPLAEMEYYFSLVTAATQAAIDERFALVIVPETQAGDFWDRLLLDGAVIADPQSADAGIRRLAARGLPVVTIGRNPDAPDSGHWVDSDPEAATRMCLDHLVAGGARNVAAVSFMNTDYWTQACLRTYHAWCEERRQRPRLEIAVSETDEALRDTALRVLDSQPRPDAVYGFFELISLTMLKVAHELGIAVPGDLMVASSSDIGFAPTTTPPMTTLDYAPGAMAREAICMLIQLVRGDTPAEPHKLMPVTLIARASTQRK
jgi:DNA-binding LacI/PurR family transcriptional regulator